MTVPRSSVSIILSILIAIFLPSGDYREIYYEEKINWFGIQVDQGYPPSAAAGLISIGRDADDMFLDARNP